MAMMLASTIAFTLIDQLSVFKSERAVTTQLTPVTASFKSKTYELQVKSSSEIVFENPDMNSSDEYLFAGTSHVNSFRFLMILLTCVCFVCNGALPSIQTYSCLPYGNVIYHLAVTLSAMVNPLMAFAAFFIPCKSPRIIAVLALIGSVFASFILATALYSPDKLLGQEVGGALTVR